MRVFLTLLAAAMTIGFAAQGASSADALRGLAVQDSGRIKPYDTFARESLELIYGKTSYEKKPAFEIVMTWVLQPQLWQERAIFEVKHHLVKRALGLPTEGKYFSADELLKNEKLATLVGELQSKREMKEKLDPYYQALQRLENQLGLFREIAAGRAMRFIPAKDGPNWRPLTEMNDQEQASFLAVTKAFVATLDPANSEARAALEKAVEDFKTVARNVNPAEYPADDLLRVELHYNDFHPFKWAWMAYFLAVICLVLLWILKKPGFVTGGWVFTLLGFALHFYGFALRVYLTGRPPVSNMYETVLWVSFGTVMFAMIIEAIYRWRVILLAGAAVGAFCLILTDLAPAVLDPSLQPLEPVLRSNFWLTVHVLTITISYAAFFLAFALGDLGLFFYLKDEQKYEARIKAVVLALYRAMQIGVAFLAPGIILGGVWADYSWGRFWGWDPKETWALIALLGYLAVLHARLAGLIKNFGMVCTAVVTFSLVIMAWYGVNFVLGAGLHSYGFGAGGVEYVGAFVALHLLAVVFVTVVRRGRLSSAKVS